MIQIWSHSRNPEKAGNGQRYDPGCIGCGTKRSSRFRNYSWAQVDRLQSYGIAILIGNGVLSPWACGACDRLWRDIPGLIDSKLMDAAEAPQFLLLCQDPEDSEN